MMKSLLATTFLILPLLVTASAQDPFAPDNVEGKLIQFSIEGGIDPLATEGAWTGKFISTPENRFVIQNVTGKTTSGSGIWKYVGSPFTGSHSYSITPFFPPDGNATITFWPEDTGFRFYIAAGEASQWGIIGGPEIGVQQPTGNNLQDGGPSRNMGGVKVGRSGKPMKFWIKNTGEADLTGLVTSKKGSHKGDFKVGAPRQKSLKPGESTSFNVTFKPRAKGKRSAVIRIASNDIDENPFDIKLTGKGK